MGKYFCEPQHFTGVGYQGGVKQCEYLCYPLVGGQPMRPAGKKIVGPAMDLPLGDVCYGVDYHEQWINSMGTFTNMPDSLQSFIIEPDSIKAWLIYPRALRKEVKNAFSE
ncbi:MAG: hypothetical protein SVU69_12375 [Pseudomonadota bacterium]|nr:hypothetical protein [Pseudomonadota bacterium]